MNFGLSGEGDDGSETIAIQKESAITLTFKGFLWTLSLMDEVAEVCRNINLFRKAILWKASIASS